jgi:hypothetical protein
MNVNCLSCGHALDLREAYDDYDGQVKCFICGALLTIHTSEGQIKSVELARRSRPAVAPAMEESVLQ